MQHCPFPEHAFCDLSTHKPADPHMTVIPKDTCVGGSDLFGRAFEKLEVDIVPTHERTRDVIAQIAPSCIYKDAVEDRVFIPKWLGCIDQLCQGRDNPVSSWLDETFRSIARRSDRLWLVAA